MRLPYKILSVTVILLAAGVLSLALYVSHTSPCAAAPPLPAGAATMKAAVRRCYGSPDVVRYEEIPKPGPADHELLVRLHAASVNPLDFHFVEGTPYLVRTDPEAGFGAPRNPQFGVDFAGTVEAVGRSVTRFKVGDEVFGGQHGAFAEYLAVPEDGPVALKPSGVTFEQAAALPIAGITALQALRDRGELRAGQKVLVNGASGGVGTYAVQIAKSMGAEVTGVCSTKNLELVRSLGADHVIDYTREDFTRGSERYDLILDNAATHSAFAYQRVLKPEGIYLMIGSTDFGHWLGFLANPLEGKMLSWFSKRKFSLMGAHLDHDDLASLAALVQSGKLTPVIDRRYPLSQAAEALAYVEKGHARGKVILTVE